MTTITASIASSIFIACPSSTGSAQPVVNVHFEPGEAEKCLGTPLLFDAEDILKVTGNNIRFQIGENPKHRSHEFRNPKDSIGGESWGICTIKEKRFSWSHCSPDAYAASLTAFLHELGHQWGAGHDDQGIMAYRNSGATFFSEKSLREMKRCNRWRRRMRALR